MGEGMPERPPSQEEEKSMQKRVSGVVNYLTKHERKARADQGQDSGSSRPFILDNGKEVMLARETEADQVNGLVVLTPESAESGSNPRLFIDLHKPESFSRLYKPKNPDERISEMVEASVTREKLNSKVEEYVQLAEDEIIKRIREAEDATTSDDRLLDEF